MTIIITISVSFNFISRGRSDLISLKPLRYVASTALLSWSLYWSITRYRTQVFSLGTQNLSPLSLNPVNPDSFCYWFSVLYLYKSSEFFNTNTGSVKKLLDSPEPSHSTVAPPLLSSPHNNRSHLTERIL